MKNINAKLSVINWKEITENINEKGFAILPGILNEKECEEIIRNYDNEILYRKKIVMERYRFGLGEYKYFDYPLPPLIQNIRENVYPHLAAIANSWMKMLNIDKNFPVHFLKCKASVTLIIN